MVEAPKKKNGKPALEWSPVIQLGHVIQALLVLVMVGGWALVGYETIEKQISELSADMALQKQRLSADETAVNDLRTSLSAIASDTRTRLDSIRDQIADLRALLAAQGVTGGKH